ncbi:MAG: hypothetical protein IH621_07020 [Krumholzibacteria bacterium]|nr:hypothetical protein [Candidatus Krumholzibacteria bacterium]
MNSSGFRHAIAAVRLAPVMVAVICCLPAEGRATAVLRSSVLGAGGTLTAAGPNYRLKGTLGQAQPVGVSSSATCIHRAGFWAMPGAAYESAVPGDVPGVNFLVQNYPNPFNPITTIAYGLAADSPVRIAIFDLAGRRIRLLVDGEQPPGRHQVLWDGRGDDGRLLPSGVFIYRIEAGSYSEARRMLLLK